MLKGLLCGTTILVLVLMFSEPEPEGEGGVCSVVLPHMVIFLMYVVIYLGNIHSLEKK